MPVVPTQPGTETSDTPEMLAPIIPKATIPQWELWPARKKVSLLFVLPLRRDTKSSNRK